jgi:hypothetical protein
MNRAETEARIRMIELALKRVIRRMPEAQRRELEDSLIDGASGDQGLEFLVDEWVHEDSRATMADLLQKLEDHGRRRSKVFGPDDAP